MYINGNRAGLSKAGLSTFAGPTQWHMQKFLMGNQGMMIGIVDVIERGLGYDPLFHLSWRDFNGKRRHTNNFMS